jgi:hypothetical protein
MPGLWKGGIVLVGKAQERMDVCGAGRTNLTAVDQEPPAHLDRPPISGVGDESAAGVVNRPAVEPRAGAIERRPEPATAAGRGDPRTPVLSIRGV